jgi:hypothetical protein
MGIHYNSIQRAFLKQGPEVGSDSVVERSKDSSVPLLRIPRDGDQRSELMSITIPK